MPKLPIISSRKLAKILKEIGFKLDHTTGSHFIFYNPLNKKRVVVPFHTKDLSKGTVLSILKEASISKKEFEKLLKR